MRLETVKHDGGTCGLEGAGAAPEGEPAGGRWQPAKRVSVLSREHVRTLELEERVMEGAS